MVKILQLTLGQIARLVEGSVFQHPELANYTNAQIARKSPGSFYASIA